jgi:hypothetical protein
MSGSPVAARAVASSAPNRARKGTAPPPLEKSPTTLNRVRPLHRTRSPHTLHRTHRTRAHPCSCNAGVGDERGRRRDAGVEAEAD